MSCSIALVLLLFTTGLQLTAVWILFSMYRELRAQGMASGEAWRTLMQIADTMSTAVNSHEKRIYDLERLGQNARKAG